MKSKSLDLRTSFKSNKTLLSSGSSFLQLNSIISSLAISSLIVDVLQRSNADVVVVLHSSSVRKCKISSIFENLFVLMLLHSEIPLPKFLYSGVVGTETTFCCSTVLVDVVERRCRLNCVGVSSDDGLYFRLGENEGVGVAHTMGVAAIVLVVKHVVSKSKIKGAIAIIVVL